jgi:hypothetical protein
MLSPEINKRFDIVVPVLIKDLLNGNADVREVATNTLKQIDAEAAAKVGVK